MKLAILSFVLIALITGSFGCSAKTALYWRPNPDGTFHTNDVKRLQQKISFKIIVPTFFPEGLNSGLLSIYGPAIVKAGDNSKGIELDISYGKADKNSKYIGITEDNLDEAMNPNPDLEPKYIDISGVYIIRQKPRYSNDFGVGVWFDWNLNGTNFGVKLYNISEDDGIKIVESMVKQIK